MRKYLNLSALYLAIGIIAGASTRIVGFEGQKSLISVHSHAFSLGFKFFLIVLVLEKVFKISEVKNFGKWLVFYNVALIFMIVTLVIRGILQVNGTDFAALSPMAGISHTMISASLVWFVVIISKSIKKLEKNNK